MKFSSTWFDCMHYMYLDLLVNPNQIENSKSYIAISKSNTIYPVIVFCGDTKFLEQVFWTQYSQPATLQQAMQVVDEFADQMNKRLTYLCAMS